MNKRRRVVKNIVKVVTPSNAGGAREPSAQGTIRAKSWYESGMIKAPLESLLARVLTWPEVAQEKLLRALDDIEAKYVRACSRSDKSRAAMDQDLVATDQVGRLSDAEIEAFFKRHCI